MTEPLDHAAQEAEDIRSKLDDNAKEIRANADLTDDGRRRQIFDAHAAAKGRMDALRARVRADRARTQQAATSRLLGGHQQNSGADAISMRDATERAGRLQTAAEARQLLDRARANGDTALVRAVIYEAHERSQQFLVGAHWARLIQDEADRDSSVAADLRMLGSERAQDEDWSSFDDVVKYLLPTVDDLTNRAD